MSAGVKPLSRSFGNRTSTPPTCIAAREHGGRARVGKSRKRFKTGARSDAGTTVRHSMAGNDRKLVILQDRDMHLMRELAVMRVIDREQAKVVAGFGSTTRANARLLGLSQAGFLRRFFWGTVGGARKALYALSPRGAEIVGVPDRGPRRR